MTMMMRVTVQVSVVVCVVLVRPMLMVVVVTMRACVHMRVLVSGHGRGIFADDAELCRPDASPGHLLGPHRVRRDRQRTEGAADVVEWNAGIDERAEHHVTRRSREAIEVQNPQIRT